MAVYKRNYQRYEGPLTSPALRFLILPRYAYEQIFRFKIFTAFFVLCFLYPAGAAVFIYLHHNVKALQVLQLPISELVTIDSMFFLVSMIVQGTLALVMTTLVGPGLISPDLSNNAMPLYLSRPFSRTEYIVGKASVLMILLSAITWVPLLLLFLLQANLEGGGWLWQHGRIAFAVFAGSWVWILILSLLVLSLSAWVKWRPVAGALLFGTLMVSSGFAAAINAIMYTNWGYLIDISQQMKILWTWLFNLESENAIPVWGAAMGLVGVCAFCLLLLSRKIRAYEVVR